MGIAYSNERRTRLAARALLLLSFSLGGCATSTTGSSLMDARAEVAAPPKTGAYLPVEDMPPDRQTPTLTTDETSKLKKELLAARDRQAAAVKGREGTKQAEPTKPQ
jgi:predicted small secreted protein